MTSLSPDALRVLRQIHERGLTVRWRSGVPLPTYDDGEQMSADDWQTAERELWERTENERYEVWRSNYVLKRCVSPRATGPDGLRERYVLGDEGLKLVGVAAQWAVRRAPDGTRELVLIGAAND